jgi:hypothetical protein
LSSAPSPTSGTAGTATTATSSSTPAPARATPSRRSPASGSRTPGSRGSRASRASPPPPKIHAIELEAGRHDRLSARLHPTYAHHGDAFHFEIRGADQPGCGASLLFLNPPYDSDRLHGRLEQRFLDRWTACLAPGSGILLYIVPHHVLAASAGHLCHHFDDVRAWRFPAPLFAPFRQAVLAARRRAVPAPANDPVRRRIESWAQDPSRLAELAPHGAPLYSVALEDPRLDLEPTHVDLPALLAGFRPWAASTLVATHRTVRELIGARYQVALPPLPAHIALALCSGMLNGKRITPDRPGLPPLLVKGSLDRQLVPVERKYNRDGEQVGAVLVQRPRLRLHVLRLDTLVFHQLAAGSLPTAAADLADFNSADLVDRYGQSPDDACGDAMYELMPSSSLAR